MKKYFYTIIINEEINKPKKVYLYNYGRTKDIELSFVRQKGVINFCLSKKYCNKEYKKSSIIRDACKKIAFAHLLFYGEPLKIDRVYIFDGKNTYESNDFKIYSLVSSKISESKIKEIDNLDVIINNLLNTTFSNENSNMSCITSLLMSEAKNNYQEKFMYLWMTFNSFYKRIIEIDNKNITKDNKQISYILQKYKFGESISKDQKERKEIANKIYGIIDFWDENTLDEKISTTKFGIEISNILKQINLDMTPYSYLLTDFSYYLRCAYFHGNKPTKLLVYEDEKDILMLRVSIGVLQDFIYKHIEEIFI